MTMPIAALPRTICIKRFRYRVGVTRHVHTSGDNVSGGSASVDHRLERIQHGNNFGRLSIRSAELTDFVSICVIAIASFVSQRKFVIVVFRLDKCVGLALGKFQKNLG